MQTFIKSANSSSEHKDNAVYQKSMIYDLIDTLTKMDSSENDLQSFKSYIMLIEYFGMDKHHKYDGSVEYNEALRKRQTWCEGTFSTQKSQHNLKQLFRRGLRAASDHCFFSATALNLKRMVKCLG